MRAQAAVELIIILAIALVVFLFIFQYSSQATTSSDTQLRLAQAEGTSRDIVHAAEMLYAEGEGAKTRLYVTIPERIEGVTVSGRTINMRVYLEGRITDVPINSRVNLCGALPQTSGGYWITLEMRDNCAHIGEEVLGTEPSSVSFSIYQGGSEGTQVLVENNGESAIRVNISLDRGNLPADAGLSKNPSYIEGIASGSSDNFTMQVSAGASTDPGSYAGSIDLIAIEGTDITDTLTLSLWLTVSAGGG